MGRADILIAAKTAAAETAIVDEIEEMSHRPDEIPADVWQLIQETGRLATERLHEILASPRFVRFKAADQARLIALAQNRAYGQPKTNNAASAGKRRALSTDVTATELRELANRTSLPEYSRITTTADVEDAVYTTDD